MTLRSCPHEPEIKRLLELGHWPHSSPPDLLAHADACRGCRDLILITQTMRNARTATIQSVAAAQLPPPGVLWWRAQLRRRNAAVERIQRPILGAYIFAFAITLLLTAGVLLTQARPGMQWLSEMGAWLARLTQSQAFHLQTLWSTVTPSRPDASLMYLAPGVAMLVLIGGVVVYLATEKQ